MPGSGLNLIHDRGNENKIVCYETPTLQMKSESKHCLSRWHLTDLKEKASLAAVFVAGQNLIGLRSSLVRQQLGTPVQESQKCMLYRISHESEYLVVSFNETVK